MVGLFADRPAAYSVSDGTLYFATDSPLISYSDGAVWTTWNIGVPVSEPPDAGGWGWVNQQGSSVCKKGGVVRFTNKGAGGISLTTPLPGSTYCVTVHLIPEVSPNNVNRFHGVCLRDSVSGKRIEFVFGQNVGTGNMLFAAHDFVEYDGPPQQGLPVDVVPIWLRVKNDGVSRVFSYSLDGVNFMTLTTEAANAYLTEDQFGFFGYSDNAGYSHNLGCDSFVM